MPLFLSYQTKCAEQAREWMHRGLDLLNANTPTSLEQAVGCFERAIALRRTLPMVDDPQHCYGLAASWLNRGDALSRLGEETQLADAIRSFDEALELLADLPLRENPLYPRRLAIAWINRGTAWQKRNAPMRDREAIRCFRKALAVLDDSHAAAIADLGILRAGALVNVAAAALTLADGTPAEARKSARTSLELIELAERGDVIAAEIGFKARHVLCRAIAEESCDGKTVPPELIAAATKAVDDGLALARHWEQRGQTGFRSLAEVLFRFGCRIYQTGPPCVLAGFILESLDPARTKGVAPLNRETHESAVAALWNALKEIQRDGFSSLSTPRFEQILESLRGLRVTEERLEQLRRTTNLAVLR